MEKCLLELTQDEIMQIDGGKWSWKKASDSVNDGIITGAIGGAVGGGIAGAVAGGLGGGLGGLAIYAFHELF